MLVAEAMEGLFVQGCHDVALPGVERKQETRRKGNWTALKKVSQKNEVNRKIQLSSLYPTYSPTHSHTHTPKKRSVAEIVILLVVTRLPQTNNTGQDAQSRIGVARLVVL